MTHRHDRKIIYLVQGLGLLIEGSSSSVFSHQTNILKRFFILTGGDNGSEGLEGSAVALGLLQVRWTYILFRDLETFNDM